MFSVSTGQIHITIINGRKKSKMCQKILAMYLRELFLRLEKTVGFSIKVVERSGGSLQSMFLLNNLWDGSSCGKTIQDYTGLYRTIQDYTRI